MTVILLHECVLLPIHKVVGEDSSKDELLVSLVDLESRQLSA